MQLDVRVPNNGRGSSRAHCHSQGKYGIPARWASTAVLSLSLTVLRMNVAPMIRPPRGITPANAITNHRREKRIHPLQGPIAEGEREYTHRGHQSMLASKRRTRKLVRVNYYLFLVVFYGDTCVERAATSRAARTNGTQGARVYSQDGPIPGESHLRRASAVRPPPGPCGRNFCTLGSPAPTPGSPAQ
eukprot:1093497-Prorocentrum_minimum.AAC.2